MTGQDETRRDSTRQGFQTIYKTRQDVTRLDMTQRDKIILNLTNQNN